MTNDPFLTVSGDKPPVFTFYGKTQDQYVQINVGTNEVHLHNVNHNEAAMLFWNSLQEVMRLYGYKCNCGN